MPGTRATLIGVALLATGLAGCGIGSSGGAATTHSGAKQDAAAAKVYRATMSANSAEFRLAVTATGDDLSSDMTANIAGSYSWAANEGDVTVYGMDRSLGGITTQEIVDRNVTYLKIVDATGTMSDFAALPNPQGRWAEATVSGNGDDETGLANVFLEGIQAAIPVASPLQPSAIDPVNLLTFLRSGSRSVTDLGAQTLDGVRTTHYRTMVPLSRLGWGSAAASTAGWPAGSAASTRVDYWIDSGDRLRLLDMAVTIPRSPSNPTGNAGPWKLPLTLTASLSMSDYGITARVRVPPQSEVAAHESCTFTSSGVTCGTSS
jgi:hypothetical protein